MRLVLIVVALLGACRMPYMADLADMTVMQESFPPAGTSSAGLEAWFAKQGYTAGPRVYQAAAELSRRPGDPLVYAQPHQRRWWLTQQRSVRDLCVTRRVIYYRLDAEQKLMHAIRTHRSQC